MVAAGALTDFSLEAKGGMSRAAKECFSTKGSFSTSSTM
jgi:hypothetical protein